MLQGIFSEDFEYECTSMSQLESPGIVTVCNIVLLHPGPSLLRHSSIHHAASRHTTNHTHHNTATLNQPCLTSSLCCLHSLVESGKCLECILHLHLHLSRLLC